MDLLLDRHIVCFGLSYKTAPLSIRELVYLDHDKLRQRLAVIAQQYGFDELLVLSTCNRSELYGIVDQTNSSEQKLAAAFAHLHELDSRGDGDEAEKKCPDFNQVLSHAYAIYDRSAIEHLMNVVASLDSLVIGETQITGQFKNAVAIAADLGTLGSILDRISQEALAVGKKVRTQTAIGRKTVSISHAAIDLAKRVFGSLSEHTFLLIGAGEMAEVAAQYAVSQRPDRILVVNRKLERGQLLVEQLGMGEAYGFDALDGLLIDSDIVLSSTGATTPIISYERLSAVMAQRRDRPLFICDIAVPRDVDPRCGQLDEVYLFEVDDLKQVVNDNRKERQSYCEDAGQFIRAGVEGVLDWLDRQDTQPTLAAFKSYLDHLLTKELARTQHKLGCEALSTNQQQAVERMLASVVKKISSDAARSIYGSDGHRARHLARALDSLFISESEPQTQSSEGESSTCQNQVTYLRQLKS